jgi:hypothetical protein
MRQGKVIKGFIDLNIEESDDLRGNWKNQSREDEIQLIVDVEIQKIRGKCL